MVTLKILYDENKIIINDKLTYSKVSECNSESRFYRDVRGRRALVCCSPGRCEVAAPGCRGTWTPSARR